MDATSHLWQRFTRRLSLTTALQTGRFLAAVLLTVLVTGNLPAQTAAATGTLEGRVLNVGNGRYLANARVTVDGTKLEAITDDFGNYQIQDVPAGEVKVTATYTGLDPQTVTVNVTPGQTLTHNVDLTSKERYGTTTEGGEKVIQLDTFVVESQKLYEGDALATSEQRYAPNIKVVMNSDSFGSINEGNPGEFLKYLPGVTVDYVAADVRTVSVRGLASNFTNVYWDGMRMTSAASGTSNRVFEFEQVSINNTSRTEVTKVPTPDQPADSIGGNINFISKSAFERKGAQLNYRFYLNANAPEDVEFRKTPGPGMEETFKVLPNFDFDYTLPVNDKFGLVITGLSSNQFVEQHRWQPTWNFAQAGATPTNPYLQQFQLQDGPKTTNRASLGIKGDYKLSSSQVISVAVQENYYKSYFGNRNLNFDMGTNAVPTPITGTPLQWGDGYVTSATGRGSVTQGSSFRDKYGNTLATKANYTYKQGDWTVNAGAAYSKSRSWYRALGQGHFSNVGTTLQGVSTVSAWGINGDPSPGIIWYARNAAGTPIDERNLNNYRLGTLRDDPVDGIATMTEGKLDAEKQFNLSFPFALKAGLDWRQEVRDNRRYQNDYTYLGADGVANTADDNAGAYLDTSYYGVDPYWGNKPIQWIDANKLGEMLVTNPSYFRLGTGTNQTGVQAETFRITNSERIQERISAAYLQATARFIDNKLNVTAGVRFEKTNDQGDGMLSNPDAVWKTNPDGSYVDADNNPANGVQRVRKPEAGTAGSLQELSLTRIERGAHADRSYQGYYPGIHLTYNITSELLARFSYAKTVGRPDYANIIPATDINYDDSNPSTGFITIRNTGLKPWTADNFDLSLEYYFKKGGLVSAGVFQKNISDFWATQAGVIDAALADQLGLDPSFIGWGVSTTVNGGNARIQGGEINYIQPLTFLPGWGRYFTIKANGTTLDLSGDNTADFRGFIDKTGNFSVAFNKKPWSLNVTANYRGRQIGTTATAPALQTGAQYGTTTGFYEYYAPRTYIDINGEVVLTKHISLFAGVRNLFNKPQIIQRYNADSPSYSHTFRQEEFGVSCSVGIKGSF